MEGLFKLIFYIIIIAFWAISNIKKQDKWEEKIPDFPKQPPLPKKDRLTYKPAHHEPLREGYSDEKAESSAEDSAPSPSMTFDELLALRRQQTLMAKQKKKTKEPEAKPEDLFTSTEDQEEIDPKLIIPLPAIEQKPVLHLNSSIKEGIIWSVILGPPRSKERFVWKYPPTKR